MMAQDLTFGTTFTDHMFHVEHVRGEGWGTPKIMPFAMIPVHPAAQAIHYGVLSCFNVDPLGSFCCTGKACRSLASHALLFAF